MNDTNKASDITDELRAVALSPNGLPMRAIREIERLRAAIQMALGFYQVTHIHTALREALNDRR